MTTDVRATGLYSLSPVILGFFGTGMMVDLLKQEGTSHSSSDLLNICVKMGARWSAQVFKQARVTLSGPGAFLLLIFLKTWCTSSSLIWSTGVGRRGMLEVRGGRCGKHIILQIVFINITIYGFITILCHVGFTILQVVWAVQPN